jgi:hypothetical protein
MEPPPKVFDWLGWRWSNSSNVWEDWYLECCQPGGDAGHWHHCSHRLLHGQHSKYQSSHTFEEFDHLQPNQSKTFGGGSIDSFVSSKASTILSSASVFGRFQILGCYSCSKKTDCKEELDCNGLPQVPVKSLDWGFGNDPCLSYEPCIHWRLILNKNKEKNIILIDVVSLSLGEINVMWSEKGWVFQIHNQHQMVEE